MRTNPRIPDHRSPFGKRVADSIRVMVEAMARPPRRPANTIYEDANIANNRYMQALYIGDELSARFQLRARDLIMLQMDATVRPQSVLQRSRGFNSNAVASDAAGSNSVVR
jgi:phosphate uptake regulator